MLLTIFKPRKQAGIGLLELMLSLAIIAILLIMAVRYYRNSNEAQKISNTISVASGVIGAQIQYASFNQGKFAPDLKTLNLPDNLNSNPWGGTVSYTFQDTAFVINFPNVPPDICANILLKSLTGSGASVSCTGGLTINYPPIS